MLVHNPDQLWLLAKAKWADLEREKERILLLRHARPRRSALKRFEYWLGAHLERLGAYLQHRNQEALCSE